MNQIVGGLVARIEGGEGIRTRSFGNQVILEADPDVIIRRSAGDAFAIVRDDADLDDFYLAVDVYGPKPASFGLDGEGVQRSPSQEDVDAWRVSDITGKYDREYQHGELVTVVYVVDEYNPPHYTVDKLHESDLREVIRAGQVAVTRGLDGLALDAFSIMETYLRINSEFEPDFNGFILSTGPGRTIYAPGFYRNGTVAYWPILYAADIAAISEVLDTVDSWDVVENWLNYQVVDTSAFSIPGEERCTSAFGFRPDVGGLVSLGSQNQDVVVGATQHEVEWDSSGVGVGTFTPVGYDFLAGDYLYDLPASDKWNYYEWAGFTCVDVSFSSCMYDHYLETQTYSPNDDGAVAAKFWGDLDVDGVIVDHRELEANHRVGGNIVGDEILDYYGIPETRPGTYAVTLYRVEGIILAEFYWDGKDLANPHVDVGSAEWTYE